MLAPWKNSYDHLNSVLKSTDIIWSTKVHLAKADFSSSHVKMWDLGHKESWTLKNWCFWSVVLEKTLESPMDCKEIKPINPKGNQPWIFTGKTDAEAEVPVHWPPVVKGRLIVKDHLRKIEGRRQRGQQRMRWLNDIINSMGMHLSKLWVTVKDREACPPAVHWVAKSRTQLTDWTKKILNIYHDII